MRLLPLLLVLVLSVYTVLRLLPSLEPVPGLLHLSVLVLVLVLVLVQVQVQATPLANLLVLALTLVLLLAPNQLPLLLSPLSNRDFRSFPRHTID